jgi:hypothetical protein
VLVPSQLREHPPELGAVIRAERLQQRLGGRTAGSFDPLHQPTSSRREADEHPPTIVRVVASLDELGDDQTIDDIGGRARDNVQM